MVTLTLASVVLAGLAHAADRPQYSPYAGPVSEAVLFEQFSPESFAKWKVSTGMRDGELSYGGRWELAEATVFPGFAGDLALTMRDEARHYAISRLFESPVDFSTHDKFVAQYEVKLQQGLECGGAYMKLLTETPELHTSENPLSNETPFQIMFGPDRCGRTNKVHLIINRKDPKTGELVEKHLALPPPARINKASNLYTLILDTQTQEYEIRINGEVASAGLLTEEGVLTPELNPPKEIDDPNDSMPEDWDERRQIPDPEQAVKPDDWDEDAPFQIPDPEAVKPEDWDENAPEFIPDPEAELPEDWDVEEDGEWVAPEIPNPDCDDHGCGPWEPPMIRNPAYVGKWVQPMVENPNYQGIWHPRKIPNPDYVEDATPAVLDPIGGLGFELWTMQKELQFNNVYIGYSVAEAEAIGNATFVPKLEIEAAQEKASIPEKIEQPPKHYESAMDFFKDDPLGYIREEFRMFVLNFSYDPKAAIVNQPVAALGAGVALVTVLAVTLGLVNVVLFYLGKLLFPKTEKKAKKGEGKDEAVKDSAKTSSAAAGESAATKRK